ncbi:hypothetical protein O9G_003415 [Rozella allomycis CSF55]|uniref:Uncharacterized protein n=1 Tax=Rozella allomycis (strain CSF55) TaxID=988480 RepID=A0A075APX2_ROZAC|nr:hypothetical protein O9G_003415 [Rozella allomycis CSF55]|eukprot:EPZ32271.1 hypothetical protein O9G_003415 [Rozella allomycis CSF55]
MEKSLSSCNTSSSSEILVHAGPRFRRNIPKAQPKSNLSNDQQLCLTLNLIISQKVAQIDELKIRLAELKSKNAELEKEKQKMNVSIVKTYYLYNLNETIETTLKDLNKMILLSDTVSSSASNAKKQLSDRIEAYENEIQQEEKNMESIIQSRVQCHEQLKTQLFDLSNFEIDTLKEQAIKERLANERFAATMIQKYAKESQDLYGHEERSIKEFLDSINQKYNDFVTRDLGKVYKRKMINEKELKIKKKQLAILIDENTCLKEKVDALREEIKIQYQTDVRRKISSNLLECLPKCNPDCDIEVNTSDAISNPFYSDFWAFINKKYNHDFIKAKR